MSKKLTVISTVISIVLGAIALVGYGVQFLRWVAGLRLAPWAVSGLTFTMLLAFVFAMFGLIWRGDLVPRRAVEAAMQDLEKRVVESQMMADQLHRTYGELLNRTAQGRKID